jgi:uncharacterized membrane protein YphA (DoxX/SURF4 family)
MGEMQRLYSMFPGSSAGAALLVLRMCTVGSIGTCAYVHGRFASGGWTEVTIGALIVLIGIGFVTPIACCVAVLLELFYLIQSHGTTDTWHVVNTLLVTLSLGMLGPGAFSLDARLFGRRRVIVPHTE